MSTVKETERERYQRYLCSPEWNSKRNAVIERACGRCEKCGRTASHVHHLTYIRKYNEQLSDLQALCEECHEAIHKAKLIDHREIAVRRGSENTENGFLSEDPLTRFRGMICVREYSERAERFGVIDQYRLAISGFEEAVENDDMDAALLSKVELIRIHRLIDGLEGFAHKIARTA
jgi:phage terminase large subunit GpA-like protein